MAFHPGSTDQPDSSFRKRTEDSVIEPGTLTEEFDSLSQFPREQHQPEPESPDVAPEPPYVQPASLSERAKLERLLAAVKMCLTDLDGDLDQLRDLSAQMADQYRRIEYASEEATRDLERRMKSVGEELRLVEQSRTPPTSFDAGVSSSSSPRGRSREWYARARQVSRERLLSAGHRVGAALRIRAAATSRAVDATKRIVRGCERAVVAHLERGRRAIPSVTRWIREQRELAGPRVVPVVVRVRMPRLTAEGWRRDPIGAVSTVVLLGLVFLAPMERPSLLGAATADSAPLPISAAPARMPAGESIGPVSPSRAVVQVPTRGPQSMTPARTPAFVGTLDIQSEPLGAAVYINQQYVGATPLRIPQLRAGSHAVWIQAEGYALWSAGVRVPADKTTLVTVSLTRQRPDR
jgi:PEGA domain-containing protein